MWRACWVRHSGLLVSVFDYCARCVSQVKAVIPEKEELKRKGWLFFPHQCWFINSFQCLVFYTPEFSCELSCCISWACHYYNLCSIGRVTIKMQHRPCSPGENTLLLPWEVWAKSQKLIMYWPVQNNYQAIPENPELLFLSKILPIKHLRLRYHVHKK